MAQRDPKIVNEIYKACEDLPILARLELARNLICNRNGEPGDPHYEPELAAAAEILSGVVAVVRSYPKAAELRLPMP